MTDQKENHNSERRENRHPYRSDNRYRYRHGSYRPYPYERGNEDYRVDNRNRMLAYRDERRPSYRAERYNRPRPYYEQRYEQRSSFNRRSSFDRKGSFRRSDKPKAPPIEVMDSQIKRYMAGEKVEITPNKKY